MSDDVGSSAKGPIPTEQTEGPVVAGSMLERMTRAIGERYDGYADPVDTPNNWGRASSAARAALGAIREPSEGMLAEVMDRAARHPSVEFTAMIDAILRGDA